MLEVLVQIDIYIVDGIKVGTMGVPNAIEQITVVTGVYKI